jgi:hypothetical protein
VSLHPWGNKNKSQKQKGMNPGVLFQKENQKPKIKSGKWPPKG